MGRRRACRYTPPSADASYRQWVATYQRLAASPGAAVAVMQMNKEIDVRPILPAIRTPTLVLHRTGDGVTRVEQARYLAEHIPGARLVELAGADHTPWVGDIDLIVDEVEEFLTGARHAAESDRILATVLFTDIVGSTERAAALGDRKWRDLLGSTTCSREENWSGSAATRWIPPATASLPHSTGRLAASGVRRPSRMARRASGSTFAPAFTLANARSWVRRSAASPSISGRGWPSWPDPVRCWSLTP